MNSPINQYLKSLSRYHGIYHEGEAPTISEFEDLYIKLRKKEDRLYNDEEVKLLPKLKKHPRSLEWQMREASAQRVHNYFKNFDEKCILDLGCGNGWFTNILAQNGNLFLFGLDVNLKELRQAARVFHSSKICFLYGDVFSLKIPQQSFDFVTLNASLQYFPDFDLLINRLNYLLKPDGEIHIIDTPFYRDKEIQDARNRTVEYYSKSDFREMGKFYFHHSFEILATYTHDYLYKPSPLQKVRKIFLKPESPFPWVKISKI
ncbi:MAG: class I SAM-dependent methyltransferase [Bacteroidales bacterium]|nr:class I SAM-dependent methyltransferase [Bacteroidales bacterium]MCF8405012.1 class I SAM-dependent methyltransferase [Bacteroidales bacterium]